MFFTALVSTSTAVLVASVCFAAIPALNIKLKHIPRRLIKVTKVLMSIYLLALAIGTLFQVSIGQNVFIDFVNNGQWFGKTFSFDLTNLSISDVAINLVMGFPLGYAVSYLSSIKKGNFSIAKGLLAGFLMGFSIEMLQFILPINRCPALSDILLNSISGLIGSLTHAVASKHVTVYEKFLYAVHTPEKIREMEKEKENQKVKQYNKVKNLTQTSNTHKKPQAPKVSKQTEFEKEI